MTPSTPRILGIALAFSLATPASRVHAQYSPDRATALEMRKEFLTELDSLQSKFMQLADAFPADKYAWRPAPGVRSVGEVFMHVASEYYYWTPAVFGTTPSPVVEGNKAGFEKFERMSSKPEVLKHMKEGFAYGRQAIASPGRGKDHGNPQGLQPRHPGHRDVVRHDLRPPRAPRPAHRLRPDERSQAALEHVTGRSPA